MDGSLPFLVINSWGAHGDSAGSGYINFYVYGDGQFVKDEGEYTLGTLKGEDDSMIMSTESHSTLYRGFISKDKLATLKAYVDENVVESKTQNMMDAGVSVTYFKDEQEIVVKNNTELFKDITDLVPFKLQKESK
jgi:hypothetical protein